MSNEKIKALGSPEAGDAGPQTECPKCGQMVNTTYNSSLLNSSIGLWINRHSNPKYPILCSGSKRRVD